MKTKRSKFPIPRKSNSLKEALEKVECDITSVVYLGLDVHKNFYQAHAKILTEDDVETITTKLESESKAVLEFIDEIESTIDGEKPFFIIGYETGPTGVGLKLDLEEAGYYCDLIPANHIVKTSGNEKIKTDRRDAKAIVTTLELQDYKAAYVASEYDRQVKNTIRVRHSFQDDLKHRKQQIKSFLLLKSLRPKPVKKKGKKVNISWTDQYFKWLEKLELSPLERETLDLLIDEIHNLEKKVKQLDKKIKEIAKSKIYQERVQTLMCFIGVAELTALSFIVEVGDFNRFPTPGQFASYLGLVPGEKSSGTTKKQTGITKKGNRFLRKLAIQAACNVKKARRDVKSVNTQRKQKNCSTKMIAYADRCFERLIKRNASMMNRGKNVRLVNTALARELVCFIWGAMTNHID